MITKNHEFENLFEISASQWITVDEIVSVVSDALSLDRNNTRKILNLFKLPHQLPVMIERHGQYTEIQSSEASGYVNLTHIIEYQLNSEVAHHLINVEHHSHYTEISFSIPHILKWFESHNLKVKVKAWDDWMKTCYPHLLKAGLVRNSVDTGEAVELPVNPRSSDTLDFSDLQRLTGIKNAAEMRAWLSVRNIPFETGIRNRPFTTLKAVNAQLGVEDTVGLSIRDIGI